MLVNKTDNSYDFRSQTMRALQIFIAVFFVPRTLGEQHQYTVVQENATLEYSDPNLIDATVGMYKLNETTNALNITFNLKFDLPDSTRLSIATYKWFHNEYHLGLLQLEHRLKFILEMENFDLQTLFMKIARPPMVWPLEKGVTYRTTGWIPDSSKYPPNIPGGKYKVQTLLKFANKTNILVVNWYGKFVYK